MAVFFLRVLVIFDRSIHQVWTGASNNFGRRSIAKQCSQLVHRPCFNPFRWIMNVGTSQSSLDKKHAPVSFLVARTLLLHAVDSIYSIRGWSHLLNRTTRLRRGSREVCSWHVMIMEDSPLSLSPEAGKLLLQWGLPVLLSFPELIRSWEFSRQRLTDLCPAKLALGALHCPTHSSQRCTPSWVLNEWMEFLDAGDLACTS